jgi:hypothetical protein
MARDEDGGRDETAKGDVGDGHDSKRGKDARRRYLKLVSILRSEE